MGLRTGIVRDAWGEKKGGGSLEQKMGGGSCFSFIKR